MLTDKHLKETGLVSHGDDFAVVRAVFDMLRRDFPGFCLLSDDHCNPDDFADEAGDNVPEEKAVEILPVGLNDPNALVKEIAITDRRNVFGLEAIQAEYPELQKDIDSSAAYCLERGWSPGEKERRELHTALPRGTTRHGFLIEQPAGQMPALRRACSLQVSRPDRTAFSSDTPVVDVVMLEKILVGGLIHPFRNLAVLGENGLPKACYSYYELIDGIDESMVCAISHRITGRTAPFFCCFSRLPDLDWMERLLIGYEASEWSPGALVLANWFEIERRFDWAFFAAMPDWDSGSQNLFVCADPAVREAIKRTAAEHGGKVEENVCWSGFCLGEEEIHLKSHLKNHPVT